MPREAGLSPHGPPSPHQCRAPSGHVLLGEVRAPRRGFRGPRSHERRLRRCCMCPDRLLLLSGPWFSYLRSNIYPSHGLSCREHTWHRASMQ